MIRADEIRKGNGQIQFSLKVLETTQLQPKLKLKLSNANPTPSLTRNGIDLFGFQVLVGLASALCTVGLALWAIIQPWLFK